MFESAVASHSFTEVELSAFNSYEHFVFLSKLKLVVNKVQKDEISLSLHIEKAKTICYATKTEVQIIKIPTNSQSIPHKILGISQDIGRIFAIKIYEMLKRNIL